MAIRTIKPNTAARRKISFVDTSHLSKKAKPPRSLRARVVKTGGRNNQGRITVRHRGGGSRKIARAIDFRQDKVGVPGVVRTVEYDPLRSAHIIKVVYADGDQRYHLAWNGAQEGSKVIVDEHAEPLPGNRLPLRAIPVGSEVHNIELQPGRGASLVRSAGSAAVVREVGKTYAHLRMPSGEVRVVPEGSWATIGSVSNADHRAERIGSAGRMRRAGWRPTVRGKAMNPVDHPHGGGEGGQPIGLKHPKTPQGKPALGVKTRKRMKTNRFIIQPRPRGRKK